MQYNLQQRRKNMITSQKPRRLAYKMHTQSAYESRQHCTTDIRTYLHRHNKHQQSRHHCTYIYLCHFKYRKQFTSALNSSRASLEISCCKNFLTATSYRQSNLLFFKNGIKQNIKIKGIAKWLTQLRLCCFNIAGPKPG